MDDDLVVNAALTATAAAAILFSIIIIAVAHGDHVSRKRVLLGARSISSDVVIEELKKHQHNSCMASTHKENSRELRQKHRRSNG